jgi:hypothetical protein
MFSSVWMLLNIRMYYEVSCKCKYILDKYLLSFITHTTSSKALITTIKSWRVKQTGQATWVAQAWNT